MLTNLFCRRHLCLLQCIQFEGEAFTCKQSHLNLNIFVHAYNTGLQICTTCISHQDTPFVCTSNPLVSAMALNARHVTEKSRVILNFLSAPCALLAAPLHTVSVVILQLHAVYIDAPALLKCRSNLQSTKLPCLFFSALCLCETRNAQLLLALALALECIVISWAFSTNFAGFLLLSVANVSTVRSSLASQMKLNLLSS